MNYIPKEKSDAIRIYDSIPRTPIPHLKESNNWMNISEYFFNDGWLKSWKEYSWIYVDDFYFTGAFTGTFEKIKKEIPKMTRENLIGYYEARGHPNQRGNLFNETFAKKI